MADHNGDSDSQTEPRPIAWYVVGCLLLLIIFAGLFWFLNALALSRSFQ
jgi:hypothetical protein